MQTEEVERVWREALFCCTVMVPLLGTAYIQPPIPAFINPSEISQLNDELLSQRPGTQMHSKPLLVLVSFHFIYYEGGLISHRL